MIRVHRPSHRRRMARRGRVHVLRRRVSSSRVVPSSTSRGASERARRRRVRPRWTSCRTFGVKEIPRGVRRWRSGIRAYVQAYDRRRKRRRVGWISRRDAVFLAPRRRAESRINHRSRIDVVSQTSPGGRASRLGGHHRRGGRAHHATDGPGRSAAVAFPSGVTPLAPT